jgi:AcrB/AcrD/AcrF family
VRAALASANANSPKGAIEDGERHLQIYTNDQATLAADYIPLVIAYRNGDPVRLTDVADVLDSVEDVRNLGLSDGLPAVFAVIFRQPGANIIDTVERVKAELPHLQAAMSNDIEFLPASDRSITIRASLHDTEWTLAIAILLVTLIVFLFLRDIRAAMIPSVAVLVSIVGAMYLMNFSLQAHRGRGRAIPLPGRAVGRHRNQHRSLDDCHPWRPRRRGARSYPHPRGGGQEPRQGARQTYGPHPFSHPAAAGGSPPAPRRGRDVEDLAQSYNVSMETISRLRMSAGLARHRPLVPLSSRLSPRSTCNVFYIVTYLQNRRNATRLRSTPSKV